MSHFTWLAIYAALLGPALSLVCGQRYYRNPSLWGLYVWHESRLRDRNRIGSKHAAEPVRLGQDAGSEQYDRMAVAQYQQTVASRMGSGASEAVTS